MRMIPGNVHRLAWSLVLVLVWSCKDGATEGKEAASRSDSVAPAHRNPSDTTFSPAEIRRSGSSSPDTFPENGSVKTDSVAPAKGEPATVSSETKPPVAKPEPPAPKAPATTPAAPPAPPPPVAKAGGEGPGAEGDWVLQINIHKSEAEARAQVQKLAEQGIPAYAIPVPTGETKLSGDYWRVRVGRFRERAKAQAWGEANIVPRGLKFWVDKKANENRSAGNP